MAPDEFAASSSSGKLGRHSFLSYLLPVLLLPAVLYSSAFWVITRPSYEHWGMSRWGPILEYAFSTQPQSADVVIFGDSSAFLGIDPKLVDAQLGIRSIVLPATIGSLPVVGDRPLQMYLASHQRPRLIVFYFAAWNLDYRETSKTHLFEGEEMLFRHMDRHAIAEFGLHHPEELLKFPFRFYSSFTPAKIAEALHHVDVEQDTADVLGHVDYDKSGPYLGTPCELPKELLVATGSASVQELVHRYSSTPGMRVMTYLAPLPNCRNVDRVLLRSFSEVGAAPPDVLPATFFSDDSYYAHIRPASVSTASILFAKALQARLARDAVEETPKLP